jgi:hypothetical protein
MGDETDEDDKRMISRGYFFRSYKRRQDASMNRGHIDLVTICLIHASASYLGNLFP